MATTFIIAGTLRSTQGRVTGAVMVDFHGSIGYGQDFTDSIRNDWGGKPLEDLKAGLQAALERYPWLDGERVAGLGSLLWGLHGQLDRRQMAGPVPLPGQS